MEKITAQTTTVGTEPRVFPKIVPLKYTSRVNPASARNMITHLINLLKTGA
jgi:hypothetical protein